MPSDRVCGRNVHIYDARDHTKHIGGLRLQHGVTNANFFSFLKIILVFHAEYAVLEQTGRRLQRDNRPLQPGTYYVHGLFEINEEQVWTRAPSPAHGAVAKDLKRKIIARGDDRCWISRLRIDPLAYGMGDRWRRHEAAHVFPVALARFWDTCGVSSIIQSTDDPVNAVQNGILLLGDLHSQFDQYDVSINPDDNYKIVFFGQDSYGLSGRYVDHTLLNRHERVSDEVLRWHFRQAVLTNMRGAGHPAFEDLTGKSNFMKAIRRAPQAAERMEFELFNRLVDYGQNDGG